MLFNYVKENPSLNRQKKKKKNKFFLKKKRKNFMNILDLLYRKRIY
jgi:hypothetical protein